MTVAEMIKKTRLDNHMTQEEYGNKFGVTRQSVSSWENGKSLPDLQMLIDICNTYHISLDTLLNENHEFVYKVDFANHVFQWLKRIVRVMVLVAIVIGGLSMLWLFYAKEKNADFVENVENEGFRIRNQYYEKIEDQIIYSVPNQKIPFGKMDFYVKHVYAEESTGKYLITVTSLDEGDYVVAVNNENLTTQKTSKGKYETNAKKCSQETKNIFETNKEDIEKVVRRTQKFYAAIYGKE